jgi:Domain of unknown function (DUF4218)
MRWLKEEVKFPDGYASNWSQNINAENYTFVGFKSHDLHVFMEHLLLIASRDFVSDSIWDLFYEISNFFREICSKELDVSHIEQLEKDTVVTMCKIEKYFPPIFFIQWSALLCMWSMRREWVGP